MSLLKKGFSSFAGSDAIDLSLLDNDGFTFQHELRGHPAMSLDSLAKVIAELPEKQINYAKALSDSEIGSDFFNRPKSDQFKNQVPIERAIENIESSNAYINIIRPEKHPVFKPLFDLIVNDVSALLQKHNCGSRVIEPLAWLFIASPNAITPYHFDRYTNYLFQFSGSKQVSVFPPMDPRLVSIKDYESTIVTGIPKPIEWADELDELGRHFVVDAGQGVHIPYTAGHYVKNGPDEVSITLSFFYHTDKTKMWSNAANFNHRFRRLLEPMRVNLRPIRQSERSDRFKSRVITLGRNALAR